MYEVRLTRLAKAHAQGSPAHIGTALLKEARSVLSQDPTTPTKGLKRITMLVREVPGRTLEVIDYFHQLQYESWRSLYDVTDHVEVWGICEKLPHKTTEDMIHRCIPEARIGNAALRQRRYFPWRFPVKTLGVREARNTLSRLLRRRGEGPVFILSHGRPVGILQTLDPNDVELIPATPALVASIRSARAGETYHIEDVIREIEKRD